MDEMCGCIGDEGNMVQYCGKDKTRLFVLVRIRGSITIIRGVYEGVGW